MGKTLLIEDPIPHIVINYSFPILVPHLYSHLSTSIGHEHEGYLLLPQPPQRLRSTGHGGGAARHHAVDVQHHSRATEAARNHTVGGRSFCYFLEAGSHIGLDDFEWVCLNKCWDLFEKNDGLEPRSLRGDGHFGALMPHFETNPHHGCRGMVNSI